VNAPANIPSDLPAILDAAAADAALAAGPAPEPHPDRSPALEEMTAFTRTAQAAFLAALSQCGSVRRAARASGISHQTAYRARSACPAFRRGWDAALLSARAMAEDVLATRALDGVEEAVFYRGELIATRRRYDSRLLLAHLARLDRLAEDAATDAFAGDFPAALARFEEGSDRPERQRQARARTWPFRSRKLLPQDSGPSGPRLLSRCATSATGGASMRPTSTRCTIARISPTGSMRWRPPVPPGRASRTSYPLKAIPQAKWRLSSSPRSRRGWSGGGSSCRPITTRT
jgi:hypothetical protein